MESNLRIELQVLVRKPPYHQCWALGRCQTHVCGLAPEAALQFDVHHTELVQSTLVQRTLEFSYKIIFAVDSVRDVEDTLAQLICMFSDLK